MRISKPEFEGHSLPGAPNTQESHLLRDTLSGSRGLKDARPLGDPERPQRRDPAAGEGSARRSTHEVVNGTPLLSNSVHESSLPYVGQMLDMLHENQAKYLIVLARPTGIEPVFPP
jgi:hypothetical protein